LIQLHTNTPLILVLQVSAQVLEVYQGATLSDNMIMYQYFLLSLMGRETAQVIFL